ncbi:MAG: hypothetical protein RL228_291, partial [Actinomycetota bacterium]
TRHLGPMAQILLGVFGNTQAWLVEKLLEFKTDLDST